MNMAFLLRRSARRGVAFANLRLWPFAYRRRLAQLPRIQGPALVVGSAPDALPPEGITAQWFRISVNGSQAALDGFGLPPPDLSVFRSLLAGNEPDEAAQAAWRALAGRSSGHLLVGSEGAATAARIAAQHGYQAVRATVMRNGMRGAVVADVLGEYLTIATNEKGVSNGIFATLLALKLGARLVVMSGFSMRDGWSYAPGMAGPRYHQEGDRRACQLMRERHLPVFAADQAFAAATGLPLWRGQGS